MTSPAPSAPVPLAPSRRRRVLGGLPAWSWVVLAVALVVGVAGSAALGAGLGSAAGRDVRETLDDPARTGPGGSDDEPTEALPPTPTRAPGGGDGSGGSGGSGGGGGAVDGDLVQLDEHVDLGGGAPAIWSVPIPSGWDTLTFDEGGVNSFSDPVTGCSFTSSQNQQPAADTSATSDRADTEATQALIEHGFTQSTAGATVRGLDAVVVDAATTSGAAQRVEMLTSRFDYPLPATGEAWTNRLAVRAMPEMSAMVYLVVNCPTTVADSADDPWQGIVDQVELLPGG